MKTFFLSLCILSALAVSSCHKNNDSASSTTANVMFINGCAGTTGIDVSANNSTIQSASNLAYLKNTAYLSLAYGTYNITFFLTNLGTPLKSGTSTFTTGSSYTVCAGGLITNPSYVLFTDDLSAPSSGMAKIRFINLSNDTLSETASVGTNTIATGITAQSASSFSEVAVGSYTIKAGDPANISTVVSAGPQQLNPGKIYTIILTGTLSGTGASGLTLTVITNN